MAGWLAGLDGWMGQADRSSRQFHFPSALLVQHQHPVSFSHIPSLGSHSNLQDIFPYQHVSISVNRGWLDAAFGIWSPCGVTRRTSPLIRKKAKRWVSAGRGEVLLIGVSAGTWRRHAGRGQQPGKGLASFENIPGLGVIATLAWETSCSGVITASMQVFFFIKRLQKWWLEMLFMLNMRLSY